MLLVLSGIMKPILSGLLIGVLAALVFAGCKSSETSTGLSPLVTGSVKQLSSQECEQYLMENTGSNIRRKDQDLLAIVFPCTPRNLRVYNWRRYKMHLITEEEFKENADRQARTCLGLAYNGENDMFVDPQGRFVKSFNQIDSMLFIITLESRSSGLNPFLRGYFKDISRTDNNALSLFLNPAFSPSSFPDISRLKDRIKIEGDREYLTSPTYVRNGGSVIQGRKGDLFVMFPVTAGMRRYLETHDSVNLKLEIGDEEIIVAVPLWL